MSSGEGSPAGVRPQSHVRWAVPVGLLVVEFLAISLLVDLPTGGAILPAVDAARVAIPVVLGAAMAGWLVARSGGLPAVSSERTLPPWRPGLLFVGQVIVFAATVALGARLLGAGAPPLGWSGLMALLGCGAALVTLAAAMAAPFPFLARKLLEGWRVPLLAVALGIAVWRTASAAEQIWGTLAGFTLRAAAALLRVMTSGVRIDLSQGLIGVGEFAVTVAPECSGVDGLGLVLIFDLIWVALARERIRAVRALLLVPLSVVVTLAANVARITGLVLIGAAGHEDLAVGGFHSKVGWALFLGLALAFVAVAEHLPWLQRTVPAGTRSAAAPAAETALVAPLVAALATALLTGIWRTGALDRAYALRILAGLLTLLAVRGRLPSLRPSPSAVPVALGLLAGVLWVAAVRGSPGPLAGELLRMGAPSRVGWVAVRALGSVAVIPLVEELAFRGFLLDWLAPARQQSEGWGRGPWVAIGVSAVAFGALHASFGAGLLAGLLFGALRAWRGRLGDAVLAHAAANLVICAAAVLLGRWDLWAS